MKTFYHAVSLKRAHGSETEMEFAAWLATRYNATMVDLAGNIHFDRRDNNERTLFTAHTDTVHFQGGENTYTVKDRFVCAEGDVLGADDAAGLAILGHMMDAGVPGYYIFFRGEEVGGVGSRYLAKEHTTLLEQFDRAVAFDRAGYYDVITHQAGERCCSDEFADALADALNIEDTSFWYTADSTGVYTDTAEFVDIVPECTNLSVGYFKQHTPYEEQDVEFLEKLAQACVKIAWEDLPTQREPGADYDFMDYDQTIYETCVDEFMYALYEAYDGNPAKMEDLLKQEMNIDYTPAVNITYQDLNELLDLAGKDLDKAYCTLFQKCSVYEH